MAKAHFGVTIPQIKRPWAAAADAARSFEAMGFDSLWVCDHLYGPQSPQLPILEAWSMISGLAIQLQQVAEQGLVGESAEPAVEEAPADAAAEVEAPAEEAAEAEAPADAEEAPAEEAAAEATEVPAEADEAPAEAEADEAAADEAEAPAGEAEADGGGEGEESG